MYILGIFSLQSENQDRWNQVKFSIPGQVRADFGQTFGWDGKISIQPPKMFDKSEGLRIRSELGRLREPMQP